MIRALNIVLLVVSQFLLSCGINSEKTSDIWIVSGQSNIQGGGKMPGPESTMDVLMYNAVSNTDSAFAAWVPAIDPMPMLGPRGVGPVVTAAHDVARNGIKIKLTGYALGGMPISHWNPGEDGYKILMQRIRRSGQGAGVYIWYQGEGDSIRLRTVDAYLLDLRRHISRVRAAAHNPDMVVVIVQVTGPHHMGIKNICEAQRLYVMEDKKALLVPAVGRELEHDWHLSSAGLLELGHDIANALLKNVYHKKGTDWPGPVLNHAVLGADRKTVYAHFAEVDKLRGVRQGDFYIVTEKNLTYEQVAIDALAGNTTVTLKFASKIVLPAQLGYGLRGYPYATLTDENGIRAPQVLIDITEEKPSKDVRATALNGAG